MVQPYNYQMAGIQSPFESVVQGLRLGATLESLQLEREKQQQAMALAQQQAAEQRQNQEFMTGFFGRVSAGETPNSADWLRIGTMLQPEQVKMAENIRQQMGDKQQFNTGSSMARLVTALWRNPQIADQEFENLIQANPNDAPGLQRLRQIAKTDPRGVAVMVYGIGLGMGGRIAEAVKGLPDLLGMKPQAEGQPPEKVQIVQWLEKATPAQRELFNRVFPANVADLSPQQQLEWYKNLSESDRTLYDQMRGAGRAPLVQNVLPGQPTPPTEFEKKLDEKGSNVYISWALEGGAANARARIAALQDVVNKLQASATGKGPTLSGVQIQVIPEALRPLLVPAAQEARQNAERVIQDGLRAILGAQFTQVEGENFLKRAFDPALGPDRNARRLSLILEQMKESAKQAQAVADYVEQNKSLRGFKGAYPSLAQFEAVLAKDTPPAAAAQQQTGAVATPVPSGNVAAPVTTTPQNVPGVTRLQPLTPPAGSAPPPARQRNVEDLLRQYGGQR
jgi:hypothetical protein